MAEGTSVRRGNPRLFGVGGFEGMGWKREVGSVGEWEFELVEGCEWQYPCFFIGCTCLR